MIGTFDIDSTRVAYTAISNDGQSSRRQREIEAVARIVRHLAGDDAVVEHDADGAPILVGYNISISHSRALAVVALDRERRIGIDAEEWRPTLERTAPRFLSADEVDVFRSPEQLLKAWTVKEAVYKIVGKPAVDFRQSISITPDMTSALCQGIPYSITSRTIGDTLLTLAVKR